MQHEETQLTAAEGVCALLAAGEDPYPQVFEIQPSASCNQQCSYCFHGGGKLAARVERELFAFERYQKLLTELHALGVRSLSISGGGEPLLYQKFAELVWSAKNHGIKVRIVTNGSYISQTAFEALLGADEVRFSVDAVRPETYSSMRGVPGNQLKLVLDNLKVLIKERQSKEKPAVGVSFLVTAANHNEVGEFSRQMLNEIGVDSVIVKYDVLHDEISQEIFDSVCRQTSSISDVRMDKRPFVKIRPFGMKCFLPHFKIAANPWGEVFSCCLGAQAGQANGYLLGDLKESSFEKIWVKSKELRKSLRVDGVSCRACNHTDYQINTSPLFAGL